MLQRIFLIVAILAGIGVIVVSQTKLREHIQGIIAERNKNATDRDAEKKRANGAEKTLASTSNNLVNVSAQLKKTKDDLATANSNLETASGERDKALQNLEKAKEAETAARQELAAWSGLGKKPAEIKAALEDLQKAQTTVAALEAENKILERAKKKFETELALLLGGPDTQIPLPTGLKGKILVVDPKWDFVVLNVGENQGVVKGGVLMVHRDSKLIGKVKISNVMPDRCIANIMTGWKLDEIREGDLVMF
jgi:hypothetical protein